MTADTVSITFWIFDPIEVSENQLIKKRKWEMRIINTSREKKEVCNMLTKEKPNPKDNMDSMEVEVMNTQSG